MQTSEGVQDWFRSDEVEYISVAIQEHCSHSVLSQLGRLGVIQFTDLNVEQTVFQRKFVREVQRCDGLERKLKYLEEQMVRFDIPANAQPDVEEFLDRLEGRKDGPQARSRVRYMDNLEARINEKEAELTELNNYNTTLNKERETQEELKAVLATARNYASGDSSSETYGAQNASDDVESGGAVSRDEGIKFSFVTGVIAAESTERFKRMVFRSTRGNCLVRTIEVEEDTIDPATGKPIRKDVFIIFFQSKLIKEKIERIANAFLANIYKIPDLNNKEAIEAESAKVHRDLDDRKKVLEKNESDIKVLLAEVASVIEVFKWITLREKSIFHTMNHFNTDVRGVLRAEGWVLTEQKEQVASIIQKVHSDMAGGTGHALPFSVKDVPKDDWPAMPPTFFKVNKFTRVYQVIVDTYGTPRYQEANPALLTVTTFPFSFGVMFGDIGHGFLVTLFAIWVIRNAQLLEKSKDEFVQIIHSGRYVLFFMGFFATYCGFIYNDFFAMGLHIWPTTWGAPSNNDADALYFEPLEGVYPLGIDPTWHRATNDLLFFNSVKMKMSVIFGVVQMSVGLIHRVQNAIYFHKGSLFSNLDLWFEAVPMLIFMWALFGYMCFMIIYKWTLRWVWDDCFPTYADDGITLVGYEAPGCDRNNCCNPPALITQLINLALKPGDVPTYEEMYEGQGSVQLVLILVAVLMLPLMLIPKPYILVKRLKADHAKKVHQPRATPVDEESTSLTLGEGEQQVTPAFEEPQEIEYEAGHGPGDIWIHQAIETIEFALGSISNTASYLRLWALSLAHSQLSSVFLEKALLGFVITEGAMGPILTFIGYGAFAGITFGVLLCMDQLECFLHALRLHWVEYQSKFFHADGIPFSPFSFHKVLGVQR